MAKWWKNLKKIKSNKVLSAKKNRFLDDFDMAEAKRAESILNAQIKRGEAHKGNFRYSYVCACGVTGCVGFREL